VSGSRLINGIPCLDLLTEKVKETYRYQRRAIGPSYSVAAIEKHEKILNTYIDTYISKQKELRGQWLNLSRWMHIYALDALSIFTLSKSPDYTSKGHDDGIELASDSVWAYFTVVGLFPSLVALTQNLPKVGMYLVIPIALAFGLKIPMAIPIYKFARSGIMERLSKVESAQTAALPQGRPGLDVGEEAKKPTASHGDVSTDPNGEAEEDVCKDDSGAEDLLGTLINEHIKKGDRFPAQWVLGIAITSFGAGHGTVTTTLSGLVYNLAHNPTTLARLHKDLEDAGVGRDTSYTEIVNRVPYMLACLKEAMRLHPAIGFHLQRVVPASGFSFSGHYLPGGTMVGASPIAVHHDPSIFEDPEEYRPERWLQDGTEEKKHKIGRLEQAWLGFGGGSRSCAGQNLARLLVVRLAVRLVQEFRVEVKGKPFLIGWFESHFSGVDVRFSPRIEVE
jgi:hypothetical protein